MLKLWASCDEGGPSRATETPAGQSWAWVVAAYVCPKPLLPTFMGSQRLESPKVLKGPYPCRAETHAAATGLYRLPPVREVDVAFCARLPAGRVEID